MQPIILTDHPSPTRSPSLASKTPSSTAVPNSSTTRPSVASSAPRPLTTQSGKPTASLSMTFPKSPPSPHSPLLLRPAPKARPASASSRDETRSAVLTKVCRAFSWSRRLKACNGGNFVCTMWLLEVRAWGCSFSRKCSRKSFPYRTLKDTMLALCKIATLARIHAFVTSLLRRTFGLQPLRNLLFPFRCFLNSKSLKGCVFLVCFPPTSQVVL